MAAHTQISFTVPPDRQEIYHAAAAAAGLTLSEWIAAQCDAALPARQRRVLIAPTRRGRPAGKKEFQKSQ